ncbi:AAA family ATPase [Methylacidimicrobium cyclopophantes]|uniref:AAA family ATPase n=1 Tax=Methylacidimicrobium cyclopophantes TaxID=1041766 RepID=UPI001156C818|nr:AAA family ATPase [Methylacidimicrobium cyclopophantes]
MRHLHHQRRVCSIWRRVTRVIVGQETAVLRGLIGSLSVFQPNVGGFPANGHCTFIGLPGTGKSTMASVLAQAIGGTFSRVQCTADLLPRDFTGSFVEKEGRLVFEKGPLFSNVVLCDEYNRAPEKARSGVLQAKIEGFVSVTFGEERSFSLPRPNIIFMTLNPMEVSGLYQIGDADRDRSLFQIFFAPLRQEERIRLLERAEGFLDAGNVEEEAREALTPEEFEEIRAFIWSEVRAGGLLKEYLVRLTEVEYLEARLEPVRRELETLAGISLSSLFSGYLAERPALGLLGASKVVAFLGGSEAYEAGRSPRLWVTPSDVREIYADVMNHRIRLSEELEVLCPKLAPRLLERLPERDRRSFRSLSALLPREIVVRYLLQEIVSRVPDLE